MSCRSVAKLSSSLLSSDAFCLICRLWCGQPQASNVYCGTVRIMAPEQVECREEQDAPHYGPERDVWALGVTVVELLTATNPFIGPRGQDKVGGVASSRHANLCED